jgi:hypothetical protein
MAGISDRYLPVKNANGSASASNFALWQRGLMAFLDKGLGAPP